MKRGVLGGTFDPIHKGHLLVAEEVRAKLKLAEVIFMPAGQPWLDKTSPTSPAEHRVEMVRLAIANKPYFKLSTLEIDELPSNTVDAIAELLAEFPSEDELFLIISLDTLAGLPRWWQPWRLINLCHLVVVPRPGYPPPDIKSLEAEVPGLSRSLILLDKPEIDISATEIRNRVRQGLPIQHLVPEPVAKYIKQYKLYLT